MQLHDPCSLPGAPRTAHAARYPCDDSVSEGLSDPAGPTGCCRRLWATSDPVGHRARLRRRCRWSALFCLGLVLGLVGGLLHEVHGAAPDGADLSVVRARLAVLARPSSAVYLLRLLDGTRRRDGRRPLRLDPLLSAIARARSRDMIARHYFSHHIPGAGNVFAVLDRRGVRYDLAGENLALNNYALFMAPDAILRRVQSDLAHSRDHLENMVDPGYTRIGIGLASDPTTGQVIVTEIFAGL